VKQLFRVLFLLFVITPAAQARVDSSMTIIASIPPASANDTAAPTLADKIGDILDMRAQMTDRMAPQPTADCEDPKVVARRLAALESLDAFVRMTVNGLIDAAPNSELKASASEDLAPVLIRHRQDMSANLMDLIELPLVREMSGLSKDVVRLTEQAARP
jgi:hypothetical protein